MARRIQFIAAAFCLSFLLAALAACCGRAPNVQKHGGVKLVYQVDAEPADWNAQEQMPTLCERIRARLDPGRSRGVVVQALNEREVEISIPKVDKNSLVEDRERIAALGVLEFLIVANSVDHQNVIDHALESDQELVVVDGKTIGRWVRLRRESANASKADYFGLSPADILRGKSEDHVDYERIDFSIPQREDIAAEKKTVAATLDEAGYRYVEVLLVVDPVPEKNISGQHLRAVRSDSDANGEPAMQFTMTPHGAQLLEALTAANRPDIPNQHYRRIAIVINNEVYSAPRLLSTISDSGQVTGNFTQDEVDFLVDIFRAGRLPVPLKADAVRETWVQPK